MEGKSLAMAYCGSLSDPDQDHSDAGSDIVPVDFTAAESGSSRRSRRLDSEEPLFEPLHPFIASDHGPEWHEPSEGLAAVRIILDKLRAGAAVSVAPDYEFGEDDDEDLAEGVREDLETLGQILKVAAKAKVRFHLALDA